MRAYAIFSCSKDRKAAIAAKRAKGVLPISVLQISGVVIADSAVTVYR
jgi:hypothetical protein